MSAIIKASELSCFYGVVLGLNNVSFEIQPGIVGLVGPNGAGKSTLIRLVTGQISPSSGSLEVFGKSPWSNPAALSRIGYCPEHERIQKGLQPLEWLRALGMLSGLPWGDAKRRAKESLERVRLPEAHWKKRIEQYSKGMRQRVKLAQAIMHRPDLVVLDEPMNGLDPMGRHDIGEILKSLRSDGVSVLISSHILHELEALCGHVVMLNWGRVLASGNQGDIRAEMKAESEIVSIRTDQPRALAERLAKTGLLRGYLIEGDRAQLWVEDSAAFNARWTELLAEGDERIFEMRNASKSLASLFERMTK